MDPVSNILVRIIESKDHRHRLKEPMPEIDSRNSYNGELAVSHSFQVIGSFHLNSNFSVFYLPIGVVRGNFQVDSIIMRDSLHGKSTMKSESLHMVHAEIG